MNLENIVPPLEDCKRIPAGKFTDSLFVWCDDLQGYFVLERPCTWAVTVCPAPTLAEILAELPYEHPYRLQRSDNPAEIEIDTDICGVANINPATAALRMWERVNGGK